MLIVDSAGETKMQPRETRKAIRDLKRLCKTHGIEFNIVPGRGSHQGLVFHDPKEGTYISITIAGHKEISPGVQRQTLKYIGQISKIALAVSVKKILEQIFGLNDGMD